MAVLIGNNRALMSRNICDLWTFNAAHTLPGEASTDMTAAEWFAIGVMSARAQVESGLGRHPD